MPDILPEGEKKSLFNCSLVNAIILEYICIVTDQRKKTTIFDLTTVNKREEGTVSVNICWPNMKTFP